MRTTRKGKKRAAKLNARKDLFLFIVRFNLYAIPLYMILLTGFHIPAFENAIAGAVSEMLKASDIPATLNENEIRVPMEDRFFNGIIDWDCTGWKSMLAFAALVLATDSSRRKKMKGMLLIPLIVVINLIRVWFMFYYVSTWGLAGFDFVHFWIWSAGMIATVLVLWIVWMKKF